MTEYFTLVFNAMATFLGWFERIYSDKTEFELNCTYDGINGAGRACPAGRPCGNGGAPPPPGRFGTAGAARAAAGGGGRPRLAPPPPPPPPKDPYLNEIQN